MLFVLVKLGDAATVGVYALGIAVCQPILTLTNLHLRAALVTDARHEYSYGQYIGLRLAGAALTVIIATAVVFIAGYPPSTKLVIILISIGVAVISVREVFLGIAQKHECMNLSGQSQIILSFAAFSVFVTIFGVTRELAWTVLGLLVVRTGLLLIRDIPKARSVLDRLAKPGEPTSLRPDWSLGMLGRLSVRVLPLGVAMAIGSFSNNVPHYFLQGYHGASPLGYYAAIASITQAAIVLINTLGIAASPRLAEIFISDRRAFGRLLIRLQAIAAGLGLLGIVLSTLFGEFALAVLYGPEYAAYATEFIWLTVAMTFVFMASMFVYAIMAARVFVVLLCAWCAGALVSVVSSILLIPARGVQGAAWAQFASSAALLVAAATAMLIVMKRAAAEEPGAAPFPSDNSGEVV
ncbi:MAG TPA: hypothetical protein VM487_06880 [Phycisphaerae bacterium]|nr:hypothetical protein [Phycisphaerae bacterium]